MKVLPLHPEIQKYLEKRNLKRKFEKQKGFFEQNPFHPSPINVNVEALADKK